MYLAADGGGTKLVAARFGEDFTVLARGRSGGVNRTQNDPESIRKHVDACLDQVLDGADEIKEAFVVFVGDHSIFESALRKRAKVGRITYIDEPTAGLLAGAGKRSGLLALSGTGSDVFWITQATRVCVGGWGPVLGDQGSGTWIGLQAVRAVCRELNGWGEETLLTPLIRQALGAEERAWNLVPAIYGGGAPFPVVAKLVPVVARAAREGDNAALAIFRAAGDVMATQMKALYRRVNPPKGSDITLCGGAWKAHPAMLQAFASAMREADPYVTVNRPWFEHMAAGPMMLALDRGLSPQEARARLMEKLSDEILS